MSIWSYGSTTIRGAKLNFPSTEHLDEIVVLKWIIHVYWFKIIFDLLFPQRILQTLEYVDKFIVYNIETDYYARQYIINGYFTSLIYYLCIIRLLPSLFQILVLYYCSAIHFIDFIIQEITTIMKVSTVDERTRYTFVFRSKFSFAFHNCIFWIICFGWLSSLRNASKKIWSQWFLQTKVLRMSDSQRRRRI